MRPVQTVITLSADEMVPTISVAGSSASAVQYLS
jgi:hypothetical protein